MKSQGPLQLWVGGSPENIGKVLGEESFNHVRRVQKESSIVIALVDLHPVM